MPPDPPPRPEGLTIRLASKNRSLVAVAVNWCTSTAIVLLPLRKALTGRAIE